MVRLLLENGAKESINVQDLYGQTALMDAMIRYNNIDVVRLLLENGAKESINVQDLYGQTALMAATRWNSINKVRLLLENGAREGINVQDRDGQTALMLAARNNNIDVVRLLLENGAKWNNDFSEEPLNIKQIREEMMMMIRKLNAFKPGLSAEGTQERLLREQELLNFVELNPGFSYTARNMIVVRDGDDQWKLVKGVPSLKQIAAIQAIENMLQKN